MLSVLSIHPCLARFIDVLLLHGKGQENSEYLYQAAIKSPKIATARV